MSLYAKADGSREVVSADQKIKLLTEEITRLKRELEEEKKLNKILKEGLMFETWQTDFRELLQTRNDLNKAEKENAELKARLEKAQRTSEENGGLSNWEANNLNHNPPK